MGSTWSEWARVTTGTSIPLSLALFNRFCFRNDGYIWRKNCWSVSTQRYMGPAQTSRWPLGLGYGTIQNWIRRTTSEVLTLYNLRRNAHARTRRSNKYSRWECAVRSLWNRKQWVAKIQFTVEIQTHCMGNWRKYIYAWRIWKWDTEHTNQHDSKTWPDGFILKSPTARLETRIDNRSTE